MVRVASIIALLMLVLDAGIARGQAPYFTAPDLQAAVDALEVVDLDGRQWTAGDLERRVVLIDFWATWCAPCLTQIPELKRLRAKHGDRFEVLAISLDSRTRRDLIAWLNQRAVDWPQVHDGRGFSSPAARTFGVMALPASVLVVNGRVAGFNLRGRVLEQAVDYLTSTSNFDAARMPIVIR